VCTQHRLLVPAFGALAGGLDVGDAALALLHGPDTQLYLLGGKAVFTVPQGLAAG
jgi:metallophosphoesterase superfamily enzyme